MQVQTPDRAKKEEERFVIRSSVGKTKKNT